MSEYLLPGRIVSESEFISGVSGACGANALSSALRWLIQQDSPNTKTVFQQLLAWGLCAPNGVMTIDQLRAAPSHSGYDFPVQTPPAGENLLGFATHFFTPTPRAPVLLYLSNGQALQDAISGTGEDATGLQGHFITLVGYNTGGASPRAGGRTLPQGFWACDGDSTIQNPLVNGARVHRFVNTDLVYYPVSVLSQAGAGYAIAVLPKVPPVPIDPCADVKAQLAAANAKLAAISKIMAG